MAPLTLAIESSNPGPTEPGVERVSVCLGKASRGQPIEVIARQSVPVNQRDDEALIPTIDLLVRGAGFAARDLNRLAVSIGPGGFTGLRVATAFVKTVCEVIGAECIAVPTTRALIRRVDAALRHDRPTTILLAWKKADAWAESFAPGDSLLPSREAALTPFSALALDSREIIVCDAPLEVALRDAGLVPPHALIRRPCFDAVAVLEASAEFAPIDPASLQPLYPREPEAATKWRELKARAAKA